MTFLSVPLIVVVLGCPVRSDKSFLQALKSLQCYVTVRIASFQGFDTSEISAFTSKHRERPSVVVWGSPLVVGCSIAGVIFFFSSL